MTPEHDKIYTEPVDRLTRLADVMTRALESHPEYRPTDKATILLDNDEERMGGMVFHGYDDSRDALIDMLSHLRHAFKAHGVGLDVVMIPGSPEGLDTTDRRE